MNWPFQTLQLAELAPDIGRLTLDHVLLTCTALAIAALLGIPMGIWLAHQPRLRPWLVGASGLLQTIPSLALLGFLIPLFGIGFGTAVVALTLYALLPILQTTAAGILGVSPVVLHAAKAMGMRPGDILRQVELPLAAPHILGGLRIASVTTIGTTTIAAAIGAGGLGEFIFRGVATLNTTLLLAGAIPAALLALLSEGGWSWLERKCRRAYPSA